MPFYITNSHAFSPRSTARVGDHGNPQTGIARGRKIGRKRDKKNLRYCQHLGFRRRTSSTSMTLSESVVDGMEWNRGMWYVMLAFLVLEIIRIFFEIFQ